MLLINSKRLVVQASSNCSLARPTATTWCLATSQITFWSSCYRLQLWMLHCCPAPRHHGVAPPLRVQGTRFLPLGPKILRPSWWFGCRSRSRGGAAGDGSIRHEQLNSLLFWMNTTYAWTHFISMKSKYLPLPLNIELSEPEVPSLFHSFIS
jgi:hypothetical protein